MAVSTCPRRALERAQTEFEALIDKGINPTVVLHHSREDRWRENGKPIPNGDEISPFEPPPDRWMKYRSAVNGRPYYCRDWAYELRPNGCNWDGPRLFEQYTSKRQQDDPSHSLQTDWFTTSLGWFVASSADQPGNHRHWYTYAAPEAANALDKVTTTAGQTIRNAIGAPVYKRIFSAFRHVPGYGSQGDILPTLTTHDGTGCLAGIWRDIVSHFALRRLVQAPVSFRCAIYNGMDTTDSPELPLRRELNPDDWIGPNQPAYSVVTIPDFCRASISVIDVLLDGWDAAEVPQKSEEAEQPAVKPVHNPVPPDDGEPEDPHERILEPLGPALREVVEYLLKRRKMQARASVFCEKPFNEDRQPSSIVQYVTRINRAWEAKGIVDWSISSNVLRSENDHMIELEHLPPPPYKPPYK